MYICSNNLHVFVDSVVEDMCSVIIIIIFFILYSRLIRMVLLIKLV